ncbi:hypothetical protein Sjap_016085 [Stephania japonica]|uniref:Alpha/beta hydrolase fold-3 domain-containing protein n=1 Tax=Stephania japonica TaxID=461633 RepID=A0AAP0ILH9_9MAGN
MADHGHRNINIPFLRESTDPYEFLQIVYNPNDDTLTRHIHFPCSNLENDNSNLPFSAKDIPLNTHHKTWLRLYKPTTTSPHKLPLILYFHGGGFILGSAVDSIYHDFCGRLATELPAVVVSVEYRLAPENRLPAAYEDAEEAIKWVREQAIMNEENKGEGWLRELADFSNCYLMGISAGGNIVYHAALRCLPFDLKPVQIVGLILSDACFSRVERSGSEMRLANDKIVPLAASDMVWELSLPRGADRDHEYSNQTVGSLGRWEKIGWGGRCFVSARGGDPLVDRELEVARMMEREGVKVKVWCEEGGFHGEELFDPAKTSAFMVHLKQFIYSPNVA